MSSSSSFTVSTQQKFKISNSKITLPANNGTYLFDINVQSSAAVKLQSYTDYLKLEPDTITTASVSFIGNEIQGAYLSKYSLLIVTFTNPKELITSEPQTV